MTLRSCSRAATCPKSFGSATRSGGRQGPGHLWFTTFSVIFGRVGFYLPQNRLVLTNTAARSCRSSQERQLALILGRPGSGTMTCSDMPWWPWPPTTGRWLTSGRPSSYPASGRQFLARRKSCATTISLPTTLSLSRGGSRASSTGTSSAPVARRGIWPSSPGTGCPCMLRAPGSLGAPWLIANTASGSSSKAYGLADASGFVRRVIDRVDASRIGIVERAAAGDEVIARLEAGGHAEELYRSTESVRSIEVHCKAHSTDLPWAPIGLGRSRSSTPSLAACPAARLGQPSYSVDALAVEDRGCRRTPENTNLGGSGARYPSPGRCARSTN